MGILATEAFNAPIGLRRQVAAADIVIAGAAEDIFDGLAEKALTQSSTWNHRGFRSRLGTVVRIGNVVTAVEAPVDEPLQLNLPSQSGRYVVGASLEDRRHVINDRGGRGMLVASRFTPLVRGVIVELGNRHNDQAGNVQLGIANTGQFMVKADGAPVFLRPHLDKMTDGTNYDAHSRTVEAYRDGLAIAGLVAAAAYAGWGIKTDTGLIDYRYERLTQIADYSGYSDGLPPGANDWRSRAIPGLPELIAA